MLTQQRKRLLLEELRTRGQIVAAEMSERFGLSEDTIRRDLRELAAEGKLLRVHGGALPVSPTVASVERRRGMSPEEKRRLGRVGAGLIRLGQTVFIDGGTTHLELVQALPRDLAATVVTHSPLIAAALEQHEAITVIVIGGALFRHSMVTVGAGARGMIDAMSFDQGFIGANGLHPDHGLTTGDFEEAEMKRAIIARSAEIVSLITADKIGAAAAHRICGLEALSTLIVPRGAKFVLPRRARARLLRA